MKRITLSKHTYDIITSYLRFATVINQPVESICIYQSKTSKDIIIQILHKHLCFQNRTAKRITFREGDPIMYNLLVNLEDKAVNIVLNNSIQLKRKDYNIIKGE